MQKNLKNYEHWANTISILASTKLILHTLHYLLLEPNFGKVSRAISNLQYEKKVVHI